MGKRANGNLTERIFGTDLFEGFSKKGNLKKRKKEKKNGDKEKTGEK